MTGDPDLADLGSWPRAKLGSHAVIRHAYDGTLTAGARLFSFSTGKAPQGAGVMADQQELLAVDDLIAFAIHARRLIESTITSKRASKTCVHVITGGKKEYVAITRIINCIVHNRNVQLIRSLGRLRLYAGETNVLSLHDDFRKPVDPMCFVITDRGQSYGFWIAQLIDTFQKKLLEPIIDLCVEHKLILERLD